ncbi:Na/Pi cotransporter [Treponema pedis str. T A4]|uniref:Na/Pi cotransporter n=2 Tax=Treponema pedis TaxID=409322 RepID=S6A8L4_9SPIR|nr:Na/Pi cotransporter [Treponema pedis str. T A4]
MKMMSDGIQKSAGESLHRTLNFMTGNRFFAVLTGIIVTGIVQSSGATTVMTVSFVNAGMLSLQQAIGVIFGANIGTTVTAWIVSLIGFKFSIASISIPAFGIGYFLTFFKKLKKDSLGEAVMGFSLLFSGLDFLASAVPQISGAELAFLAVFKQSGILSIIVGILVGLLLTMLLHSSSATTAVLLTMAHGGVVGWEFSAAVVLGSNVGSTIDAVLAAIGTKLNARRAATVHVLFNVAGSILVLIFFRPFLALVDIMFGSGPSVSNITTRIAVFHTMFNVVNTIIALPFVNQIAAFVCLLIKPKENEEPAKYVLQFQAPSIKESAEAYILSAEAEIVKMSSIVREMFTLLRSLLLKESNLSRESVVKLLTEKEDYTDQMQEELSAYLIKTSRLSLSDRQEKNVRLMLGIVDDIENITDQIYELGLFINKSIQLKMPISQEDMNKLLPYMGMVNQFIHFVHDHLNKPLAAEQLAIAEEMEDSIDSMRQQLKRLARSRLEKGANVKAELLYIDMVRNLEKIGDYAFSISRALAETE